FPLSSWYGYERSAALYTADEINIQGNIISMSWYANNAKTVARPIKIYLKTVTADVLAAQNWQTLTDGATLIYDSSTPITVGWNTFTLIDDFNYTENSGNLLVLVETNYGGYGAGDTASGAGVRYTTSTSRHLTAREDSTPPTTNLTLGNSRPNIKINFGPLITCYKPNGININNISNNSAEINWLEVPAATDYEYEVRTDNNPGTAGAIATGTVGAGVLTANVFGLMSNTLYNVYLRTICGESENSNWTNATSFLTLCDSVTALPFFENFDDINSGQFPTCWKRPVIYASYPAVVSANSYSSPNSLRFQSQTTEPTYAISPAFSQNIETLRVKFRLKREGPSSGIIEVGIMTDVHDTSTFQLIQTINPENNNMTEYVINFDNSTITGPNRYIAIKHISNASSSYYWLDDFLVETIPPCVDVSGLGVSEINKNSARIFWDEVVPPTDGGFIYEIRMEGEPGSPGAIQTGAVESNTHFKDIV